MKRTLIGILCAVMAVGCGRRLPEYFESHENIVCEPVQNVLRVGIVVNDHSHTIPDSELEKIIDMADKALYERTEVHMALVEDGIQHVDIKEAKLKPSKVLEGFYQSFPNCPPNYVIIFSAQSLALSGGGYVVESRDLSAHGFCNEFHSQMHGSMVIYGAVIDWTHRFGICGYDLDKRHAEGVYEHISEVSLSDGSCRNRAGVKCVFNKTVNHYVCEDLNDPDHPYLQHEYSFVVSSILHELFHPFGMQGNFDHFGTEICRGAMGGQLSTEPFAFQHNFGICPNVIEKFSQSYTDCSND